MEEVKSDWECHNVCDKGYRSTDCLIDKEYRTIRYSEFIMLSQLPYYNDSQAKRLSKLAELRIRDNRRAFEETL